MMARPVAVPRMAAVMYPDAGEDGHPKTTVW